MRFQFVDGPTSSNKSGIIIKCVTQRYFNGEKSIIALPSIDTCSEIAARASEQFPGVPIEVYHSKLPREDGSGSVKIDVSRAIGNNDLGGGRIVIICHATLCSLETTLDLKEWHCYIDETLDVFHPFEVNLQDTHHLLTDHLVMLPVEGDYARIESRNDTALTVIQENRNKDAFNEMLKDVAARTLSPYFDCYTHELNYTKLLRGSGKEQKLYHLSVLHPRVVSSFSQVTVFSARFEESLQYHIWEREGVVWERNEALTEQLKFTQHCGYERLVVYWGYEANFSKSIRDKHPETYEEFIAAGLSRIDCRQFIRLENNDIKKISTLSRHPAGETIPGRSHGLNKYRHIDHAFIATATNYSPVASAFLKNHYGFGRDQQVVSFACHNIYQAISRTSMRDGDMSRERVWVVPSQKHAEWLSQIFKGSTCVSLALNQPAAVERGRVARFDNDKERKNQSKQITRLKARQKRDFIERIGVDLLENVVPFYNQNVDVNTLYIDQFVDMYRSSRFDHLKQKDGQVILMKDHEYINWLKKQFHNNYVKKDDIPLVSPAFYNPLWVGKGKRGKMNVVFASGIMMDYDNSELTPETLAEIFDALQCVTYSTYSNSPGNLRYRLYIPTTRPMLIPEYTAIVDEIIRVIEEAGYHGRNKSPAKPNGSGSESESDRFTMGGNLKRHGIDMGKRGPYSLFHLPCRSPTGHGFFNDHSGPGRAPLDVNQWLLSLPPIEESQPRQTRSNYNYADRAHTLTQRQRDGIEGAMAEWFRTGTLPKQGNDAMWVLYASLRDLHLPDDIMEEHMRTAADTANSPKDRHEQVDHLMSNLRTFRQRIGFNTAA